MTDKTHRFRLRVYYEDTDLAGIVYYANYLKFIERARSEYIRALGVDQLGLKAADGIVFAVRHIEADYLASAQFEDDLVVHSRIRALTGARIFLQQTVSRAQTRLFSAAVTLVCLAQNGRARRIPAEIRQKLTQAVE